MIRAVDHVHVMAPDMEKAIAFYTGVLGFALLRRMALSGGSAHSEIAYVRLGDVLLELYQPRPASGDTPGSTGAGSRPFGLVVDDLDAVLADLRSHGIDPSEEPRQALTFDGRITAIKDPNGLVIELKEYRGDGPQNAAWTPSRPGVSRLA